MDTRVPIISSLMLIVNLINGGSPTWHNWSENYACSGTIMSPRTKDELIAVITDAAQKNHKIRVIGSGHSLNDIACCDDLLISLKNLNEIISINQAKQQVTVQAGITLEKLSTLLAQHNLALSNLISITEPTLGGAIATASHGTGHTGTISSFITQMELITADGVIHRLSLDSDVSAFHAACVSLGTLGVLYSITLQCESLFKLEYRKSSISIDDLIVRFKQLHEENNFFQFRWNAKTNMAIIEFWNRVSFDAPVSESVQYSYEALACEKGKICGPVLCSEIAISVDLLSEAMKTIKAFVQKWQHNGKEISYINGRFAKADQHAYLSPCADYDVIFLNINTVVDQRYYEVLQDFEQCMYTLKGRPHWGKNHFLDYEKAFALYGDNLLYFIEVKKRLDPNDIFSNAYIAKIFDKDIFKRIK